MKPSIEDCYSVDEIAELLNVSPATIRAHYLAEIKVSCGFYKLRRKVFVPKQHFNRYMQKAYTPPSLNA